MIAIAFLSSTPALRAPIGVSHFLPCFRFGNKLEMCDHSKKTCKRSAKPSFRLSFDWRCLDHNILNSGSVM
jgi:hypothetical protein